MASPKTLDLFKSCRKIIGLVKNFKLPGEPASSYPSQPLLFLKPPTTLLKEGNKIKTPPGYNPITYEVELGVVIGKPASKIQEHEVLDHIGGYCVTLDITAMDKVKESAAKGHPWTLGKAWDTFTPISEVIPKREIGDPDSVNLWLKLDGEMKQSGSTRDLWFNVRHVISYASHVMTLEEGDLFLTGTPGGNGTCVPGQVIECGVEGVMEMKFEVE